MTKLPYILSLVILTVICSCKNNSSDKSEKIQNDSVVSDNNINLNQLPKATTNNLEQELDSVTTIKFGDFSATINGLSIYDEDNKLNQIQKDTVVIESDLNAKIEGQPISISSDQIIDFSVEMKYETTLSIMNEGPHCELTDWKHYYSDWKQLRTNNLGQFICDKYSEEESEKFPEISVEELKQKVKDECGENWYKISDNIKSPNEYPTGVMISRYYLRIKGKRKENGETVSKFITIEMMLGC